MRTRYIALPVALMMLLGVAGCGSDKEPASKTTANAQPANNTMTSIDAEEMTASVTTMLEIFNKRVATLNECYFGDDPCLRPRLVEFTAASRSVDIWIEEASSAQNAPGPCVEQLKATRSKLNAAHSAASTTLNAALDTSSTDPDAGSDLNADAAGQAMQSFLEQYNKASESCVFGGDQTPTVQVDSSASGEQASPKTETPETPVTASAPDQVRRDRVTVNGTTEPGATVKIKGQSARVRSNGKWTLDVTLQKGDNVLMVKAKAKGMKTGTDVVRVTRNRTQEEIQQDIAAKKARVAQRVASWKSSAETIPYNQLSKDSDRFEGKRVKYRGKILQIQEDDGGGMMLLSVTDNGWDLWSDNVWVNFDRRIKSASDDIVTVYGTVVGDREYETQIGGNTYVPEINARYIDE